MCVNQSHFQTGEASDDQNHLAADFVASVWSDGLSMRMQLMKRLFAPLAIAV